MPMKIDWSQLSKRFHHVTWEPSARFALAFLTIPAILGSVWVVISKEARDE